MEKYIKKSALVVEIKRRYKKVVGVPEKFNESCIYREFLSFIDTLEVKEVDFEKELNKEWNKCEPVDEGMGLEIASIEHEQFDNIAKHFFELGMSVNNKARKGEEV